MQSALEDYGVERVKVQARRALEELRDALVAENAEAITRVENENFFANFCQQIKAAIKQSVGASLRPVVNLTGTIIHTNLGRSRLPKEAVDALSIIASHPSNLEFDLQSGRRGDRDSHLQEAVCALTGAEAATIVNNNAAAVLLVVNTLARDKDVLISRGELVEIGGTFRIPDVMASAHARLREVGTTNRTHRQDYEQAVNTNTGLLMKVHTSNYAVQGFTASVAEQELAEIAHSAGLPFVSDLGSGTLVDMTQFGLPPEPTVRSVLQAGADLVTFSGDKLLGGVQSGIIAGRKDLVDRIKANPLKRALRVDKLTLAALHAVLEIYGDPDRLSQRLPFLRDLSRRPEEILAQAEVLLPAVRSALTDCEVAIRETHSQVGSGALPLDLLPSYALVIRPRAEKGQRDAALTSLALAFRQLPLPIIGRIHDGELWLDIRCLDDSNALLGQLSELAAQP